MKGRWWKAQRQGELAERGGAEKGQWTSGSLAELICLVCGWGPLHALLGAFKSLI